MSSSTVGVSLTSGELMHDALLHIVRDGALRSGVQDVLREITKRVAASLGVERVSVWEFSEDRQSLRCSDLYESSRGVHSSGVELAAAKYPAYIQALDVNRSFAAHDARGDPRTHEISADYLEPSGIASILGATVRRGGVAVGVVCVEHVGEPRVWNVDEQSFAASVADLMAIAIEIEERRKAEEALRRSEERYRGFIGLSAEGIWRVDLPTPIPIDLPIEEQARRIAREARFAECNQSYARMHGFDSVNAIIGKTIADFAPEETYRPMIERTVREGYSIQQLEISRPDRTGVQRWFEMNVLGVVENGYLIRFWGVQREVTERVEAMAALEYQANHDALTALWNRSWLTRRLEESVARSDGSGRVIALLLLDVDGFREVNDAISHEAGDELLLSVAQRLKHLAATFGIDVARFGGDEFAFLVDDARDAVKAASIAESILGALREPFEVEGIRLELAASIGIALHPAHADDAPALLRRTEIAMYLAKNDLQKYGFYSAKRDLHSAERLALIAGLGAAIRRRELTLHYQPKVDLHTRRLAGFEGLVRWNHPQRGLVHPAEFMPWAEKSDLIRSLTSRVLEDGVAQLCKWKREGFVTKLSMNLSARNLLDDRVPEEIELLLHRYDAIPADVILEITESSIMSDPDRSLDIIRRIDHLGVGLAIDDFGTGYSSLAYLRHLPIDELKIDLSFVTRMLENDGDRKIVRSTIDLAHNLGLSVTAEGVEDEPTLDALTEMGSDSAQGYFIGRPMPVDAASAWAATAPWR